jgi:hypothetical protein
MMTSDDDDPTVATQEAQERAEETLLTQEATVPGLPPPADPEWVNQQLEQLNQSTAQRQAAKPQSLRTRKVASLIRPRKGSNGKKPITREKVEEIEESLGADDWQRVYRERPEWIRYLLHVGLRRLQLPAIQDHTVNSAQVHKELEARGALDLLDKDNLELNVPEVQRAATKRAVSEAAIAQDTLHLVNNGNKLIAVWAEKLLHLIGQGAFADITQVTPAHIHKLVTAMETHARATREAIKTFRLTRGEPTDVTAHMVASLLVGISDEELDHACRTGETPARVLSRFKDDAGTHTAVLPPKSDKPKVE